MATTLALAGAASAQAAPPPARSGGDVDPARAWLYGNVQSLADERARAIEEEKGNVAMGRMVPAPRLETLIGTATEAAHRVIQVCVGAEHGILLTDAGLAFTWGDNRYGQLGRPACLKEEDKQPFPVVDLAGEEVTHIACGTHHCLALCAPGLVWAWGRNKAGQLGCGSMRDKVAPERVCHSSRGKDGKHEQLGAMVGKDGRIISIGAGAHSSVAAAWNSDIWQWGEVSKEFKEKRELAKHDWRGKSGKPASAAADLSVLRSRPFCVFSKNQFLTGLRKGKEFLTPVSISETGCRTLPLGVQEEDKDRVKDLVDSARQLQAAIAQARGDIARQAAKRQREEAVKSEDAGPGELNDLQDTITMLERDIEVADRTIDMLEKNSKSCDQQQTLTRQQLQNLMQQNTRLNDEQDQMSLKLYEATGPEGRATRKELEQKLADIRKFLEANRTTLETLECQKTEIDKERHRLGHSLTHQREERIKFQRKLDTLRELSKTVAVHAAASDALLKLLKDKNEDFSRHFESRGDESELVAALQEFESDGQFLQGLEARIKQFADVSSEQATSARAGLIRDLLLDLVSLRRSWNSLLENKWESQRLDLSQFFEGAPNRTEPSLRGSGAGAEPGARRSLAPGAPPSGAAVAPSPGEALTLEDARRI